MRSDAATLTPVRNQADNLRRMAEVVERQRLSSRQWLAALHHLLNTDHLPPEFSEAAAAVEGADLTWSRLAGFLRRLAERI